MAVQNQVYRCRNIYLKTIANIKTIPNRRIQHVQKWTPFILSPVILFLSNGFNWTKKYVYVPGLFHNTISYRSMCHSSKFRQRQSTSISIITSQNMDEDRIFSQNMYNRIFSQKMYSRHSCTKFIDGVFYKIWQFYFPSMYIGNEKDALRESNKRCLLFLFEIWF